jgi:lysophospholipase L1-like esterase
MAALVNRFAAIKTRLTDESLPWAERNIRMVALGDSVTQGLLVNPHTLGNRVYHEQFRRTLARRYIDRTFSMVNAGVAGESSAQGLARLQSDVLDHRPHLVIVCFGLNDACQEADGESAFRENLTSIVNRLSAHAAVILMTPNMMLRRPVPELSNDQVYQTHHEKLLHVQNGGSLARYVEIIRAVAKATSTPLADAYAEWARRDAKGDDVTGMLYINHPDARGHRIFAKALLETFDRALKDS